MDLLSFIGSSNLIHGERYNYSRVQYVNSKTKIELICLRCEKSFFVTPNDHLNKKSGCRCWKLLSLDDLRSRCLKNLGPSIVCHSVRQGKHMREIELQCVVCNNRWWSQISSINQGKGCFNCNQLKPLPWEEALKKFNIVHGKRYEYEPQSYRKWHSKIKIKCLKCKSLFSIRCVDHANGTGCKTCFRKCKITTNIFVERAIKIHGNNFDYSLVDYCGSLKKVIIGCKICGCYFKQTPNHHLNIGNGCTECAITRTTSKQEIEWLNELKIPEECRQIQIGNFLVDALVDKIIYEYYGSYWHGDPRTTHPKQKIGKFKVSAEQLYANTIKRHLILEELGYMVRFVWEYDRQHGMLFSSKHPHIKD